MKQDDPVVLWMTGKLSRVKNVILHLKPRPTGDTSYAGLQEVQDALPNLLCSMVRIFYR